MNLAHTIRILVLFSWYLLSTSADLKGKHAVDTSSLPTFPKILQFNVRWNHQQTSGKEVVVFFDQQSNRGAIKMMQNGKLVHEIYDFDSKQLLTISGISCNATDITPSFNTSKFFPFPFTIKDDKFTMMEAKVALRFYGETYLMHSNVKHNGIPCCQLRTVHQPPGDTNGLIYYDYYFADSAWVNGSSASGICSQKLIGIVTTHFDSAQDSQENTFDIFELMDYIEDDEAFQQSPGVFCDGKTEGMKLPSFYGYLKFSIEEVMEFPESLMTRTQVWYDEFAKISRHDTVSGNMESRSSASNYVVSVYDHVSGYMYQISSESGKCTPTPIGLSGDIDAGSHVWGPTANHVQQIQYVGKRRCRYMKCDVWCGIDIIDNSHKRIVEFYLNQDLISQGEGKTEQIKAVRMEEFRLSGTQGFMTLHKEYYDFQTKQDDWSVYDVSSCFEREHKTTLVFSVGGKYSQIIDGAAYAFKESFRLSLLGRLKNVSPLRLNNLQINANSEDSFFVTAVLMESMARINGTSTDEMTNKEIITKLKADIENKQFNILHQNAPAIKVDEYSISDFTYYSEDPLETKFRKDNKEFSTGDMAGIAMGMMAVGIVAGIGSLILFLRMRKNMTTVKWLSGLN